MPPPDPRQLPETVLLNKFAGMTNTVMPERLDGNELMLASNIDIDDRGQLHRRRGYTLKLAGDCHSLFEAEDGTVYGVVSNNLCIIRPNYSTVVLKAGISSDPVSGLDPLCYCQVGDTIYYSSAQDSGKIIDGVVLPWGASNSAGMWLSPVVHPTPTLAEVRGKLLGKPPMATCMTYWNGRIYMANGRQVWATELYLYDYVDKTRNFHTFEYDVTLLGTVTDGIYVGTTQGLWFLTGPHYSQLARTTIMDSGVIAGSMVDIPAELANPPQTPADADTPVKISIAFLTTTGFCMAQDGGVATNYTEAKFIFPEVVRAAAMFRRQDGINQYIAVADSGGTPVSNGRFGEYPDRGLARDIAFSASGPASTVQFGDSVDATLIRGGVVIP